jgi:N,N'-diacetyllegionaminate synthase
MTGDTTFIIAEVGANHNRDFNQAIALIDAATRAGADAVKFQTYSSETLYCKDTPDFAGYKNISQLIKDIELPREWQADLKSYCDDRGIEFMSTPFDERAIEELCNLGVRRLKIAGFESSDPRFVKLVASTQLPLIITAGIGSDIPMIKEIVSWVKEVNSSPDITILHGNNAYPTPLRDAHLNQIDQIRKSVPGVKVGISDHTPGVLVPPLAVAKGVTVVEKHFTLSRWLPGPDHPFAIEPAELVEMVAAIRSAEAACTTKPAAFSESEKEFKNAMRSVVATQKILKGEVLTEDMLTTKRPHTPGNIPASDFFKVFGHVTKTDIEPDVCLKKTDIIHELFK